MLPSLTFNKRRITLAHYPWLHLGGEITGPPVTPLWPAPTVWSKRRTFFSCSWAAVMFHKQNWYRGKGSWSRLIWSQAPFWPESIFRATWSHAATGTWKRPIRAARARRPVRAQVVPYRANLFRGAGARPGDTGTQWVCSMSSKLKQPRSKFLQLLMLVRAQEGRRGAWSWRPALKLRLLLTSSLIWLCGWANTTSDIPIRPRYKHPGSYLKRPKVKNSRIQCRTWPTGRNICSVMHKWDSSKQKWTVNKWARKDITACNLCRVRSPSNCSSQAE